MKPLIPLLSCILYTACATAVVVPPRLQPVAVQRDEMAPLTFTRMIIRVPPGIVGHHHEGLAKVKQYPHSWDQSMAAASEEFKIVASEILRAHNYNVLGGDNVLFGRDESAKASFQLGGTLQQLTYNTYGALAGNATEVKVGIEWQLYDVYAEQVVLTKVTEGYARAQSGNILNGAFSHSLTNLLADPSVPQALRRRKLDSAYVATSTHVGLACSSPIATLPEDVDQAFHAVLVIRSGASLGSAVIVSPDGYALTAAHVVSGLETVEARTHSGLRLPATVLEVDTQQDVALIKLPGTGHFCLATADDASIGAELFAIGAPIEEQLAFTLTRGIVSGHRELSGVKYIQTDASLNSGNSGGPLITADGKVVGVVSWKISGVGIEGLAFGVPTRVALARLGYITK